ncbi:MAG TPA: hypothetical protein VMW05_01775, partial [Methyloceanibacter sp.]|nr:hypothetical protein [Methyloceanibacter sp.]
MTRLDVTAWGAANGCGEGCGDSAAGATSSRADLSSPTECTTGVSGGLKRCGERTFLETALLLFGVIDTAPDWATQGAAVAKI